jgi:small-conductance mechanosensitive channel
MEKYMIQDWSLITTQALQGAWQNILLFLPNLLAAIVIFIIGWFVAIWIGKLVAGILNGIKFDALFDKTGWKEALQNAELKVSPSGFIGAIVKWVLAIIFLMISTNILGWNAFAAILSDIIAWVPNLLVAIIILVVAIIIADIVEKLVRVSAKKIGVSFVNFLGAIVKWSIYIFAGLAALVQLGITPDIVKILMIGFVGTLALALGLSFGLGGKEAAGRMIEDAKRKISDKE